MIFGLPLLPPDISSTVFLLLVGSAFLSSFIAGVFGIGGGTLMVGVLATFMPPAALIPVHGVVQLGSNATRTLMLLRHVRWHAFSGFLVGSLIGVAIGGMIVVELSPRFVEAGVGLFILWSVYGRQPEWLARWPSLAGAVSSFLTMFFGATGPMVGSYVRTLNLDRHAQVSTHAALMVVQHLLKIVTFGILGFAFGPWLPVIAGLILAGVAGTYAGRALLNRMSDVNFRRVLDAMLTVIALRLLWLAVSGG